MKACILTIGLFALLIMPATNLPAQVYAPYDSRYADIPYEQYLQYEQQLQQQQYRGYWRQNDPYYDLHVLHYELFRQPYQPYLMYPPCCYASDIPLLFVPLRRLPHAARSRVPWTIRRR